MQIKAPTKFKSFNEFSSHALKEIDKIGENTINIFNSAKSKADEFVKKSGKEIHKERVVGFGVLLAAAILAFSCLKGMVNKIKEVKRCK